MGGPACTLSPMILSLPRWLAPLPAIATFLLCAFTVAAAPAQAQPSTHTVTDLAGRTVTVPVQVDRILLGEGRLLPALGVFERDDVARRLVGMMGDYETLDPAGYAQWRSRFPQLDKVPRVGRNQAASFSDEQAIARRPQVAILGLAGGHGPSQNDRETLARLESAGVAVVFVDFRHDPLKNTPRSMELLGAVLGKRKEAEAFNTFWRAQLERVESRLRTLPAGSPRPSVFLENRVGLADDCCATMVGLVGVLLDAAGAENVARGSRSANNAGCSHLANTCTATTLKGEL
jgi:iron complex transport system substrate-binding protein